MPQTTKPQLKYFIFQLVLLLASISSVQASELATSEASKYNEYNDTPHSQFLATGAGYIGNTVGMPLLLMAAVPVLKNGFIPHAQDRFLLEASLGSLLSPVKPAGLASIQGRWDFFRKTSWALFALGGGAAQVTESQRDGTSEFKLFPRYALGAYFQFHKSFWLRAEASPQWSLLAVTHGI